MIRCLSHQFNFLRKDIFHLRRFFFLDKVDKYTKNNNKNKKPLPRPVKKEPPVSAEQKKISDQKRINLSEKEKKIIQLLQERNGLKNDYSEINTYEFELFNDFNKRKQRCILFLNLVKDNILISEYDLLINFGKENVTENFQKLKEEINDLDLHSQLKANLERMEIKNLDFFSKSLFRLMLNKKNVFIKTDKNIRFEKNFSVILPTVQKILERETVPKHSNNAISPLALILGDKYTFVSEIQKLAKLLCHKTGIKLNNDIEKQYVEGKMVDKFSPSDILITSLDVLQKLMRSNCIDFKHIDNITVNNFNDLQIWERKILYDLIQETKTTSQYSIFYNKNSVNWLEIRKNFNDFYFFNYCIKDKLETNYTDENIKEAISRINHLAILFNRETLKSTFEKIKKLMNIDGFKIIQVQGTSHQEKFEDYLTSNKIPFNIVDDGNHKNIIIDSQILVTSDLYLISGNILKNSSLIININIPFNIKNFFSIVGKYGNKVGSTITFVDLNDDKEKCKEFAQILKEFNQKIPDFLK